MKIIYSSFFLICALLIRQIGFFWSIAVLFAFLAFLLGFLSVVYSVHSDIDVFLKGTDVNDPIIVEPLGLNLVSDKKSILLVDPNIKVQSPKRTSKGKQSPEPSSSLSKTKKILNTSFFKIIPKSIKDGQNVPPTGEEGKEERRSSTWKPFENIKIYTDRKKSSEVGDIQFKSVPKKEEESNLKPKKKILSGNKQIDFLLHTIIDYILRDFIDSWFRLLSDDKEFSDVRTRNCIEESVANVCKRIKSTQWLPLITTTLVDDLAAHTRLYRLAQQSKKTPFEAEDETKRMRQTRLSPLKRPSKQHRRNKSDTDLNWHLGHVTQKNVANSRFYTKDIDEKSLFDPEVKLVNSFFDNCELFRKECLCERELENYLTNIMETILYFTLPEQEFACLPLRTFLGTLLANVLLKPVLEMASDPDFINLQIARLFAKEPPPGEFFIKMVRQCSDLSELRACRQFITKEMDLRYKESNSQADLGSLKYIQKLIDMRLSYLQNDKIDTFMSREKATKNLPILSLEEILTKELALSYYLDYLSVLNLQKYVIFYLSAQEWKVIVQQSIHDLVTNKLKRTKDDIMGENRERALNLFREYLVTSSPNYLNLDNGLIEALNIKINDYLMPPDVSWFDSICKFIYEKLKTEEIFLHNFYQSSAYNKLLLELDVEGSHNQEPIEIIDHFISVNTESGGSDSNSGDLPYDELDKVSTSSEERPRIKVTKSVPSEKDLIRLGCDLTVLPFLNSQTHLFEESGGNFRHCRSHSDCTGIVSGDLFSQIDGASHSRAISLSTKEPSHKEIPKEHEHPKILEIKEKRRNPFADEISAKIIDTAINSEGNYAVYAIEVNLTDGEEVKNWHVYRRYSKFLELKKILQKKFPKLTHLPFPPKKTFQNTQRAVLEHRMSILNEFLREICLMVQFNPEMKVIVGEFLEPDTYDKRMQSGAVVRTIETLKSGMTKIKNMPDSLVGGLSKIFLGKGLSKNQTNFLTANPTIQLENSEYPALASMINLMDEVFDLQTRSQWLRRGIVNRVLGAPWVSNAANKKIVQAAKGLIEMDKVELLLTNVLNTIWPDGKRVEEMPPREDNTKLRTRMASKIALFALLSDDLKHIVGSETTRWGLLNLFSMLQNKTLNLRLLLVVLDHTLKLLYRVDDLTKHVHSQ